MNPPTGLIRHASLITIVLTGLAFQPSHHGLDLKVPFGRVEIDGFSSYGEKTQRLIIKELFRPAHFTVGINRAITVNV